MNLVLDEIRQLGENRENGFLTLSRNGHRVVMFYREGMIQAVSSNLTSHRLGDYLVKAGYLTARDIQSVLKSAQRKHALFGEAAVRERHLEPVELAEVVRRQSLELLQHVLTNDFSIDDFTNSVRSFYTPANITFAGLFLELCRNNAKSFEASGTRTVVLRSGQDLSELPWYPEELGVLRELTHPTTVAGLVASTGMKETPLRRILGVFDQLGIIELKSENEFLSEHVAIVKRSGFPFDGLIPVISNAVVSDKLEVLKNSSSFISEQFRNLKVRINESDNPAQVMIVSSPENGDGKSLVSANLALSYSLEVARRVIIVDCDLRNPTLHRYLGVTEGPGLLQYLSNGRLAPHCYVRRLENLFFLTSGGIAENPIELLSLRRMKDLIEYLKNDFDTIILDAPPFSPIADARIVTALSDGCIMVIRRGKTSYRSIEGAFRVIDQAKLLGIVFNDVKPMLFHTYYKRGYYDYGRDSQYMYSRARKRLEKPKNYLES